MLQIQNLKPSGETVPLAIALVDLFIRPSGVNKEGEFNKSELSVLLFPLEAETGPDPASLMSSSTVLGWVF